MSVEENTLKADLEAAFEQHTAEPSQEARGSEQNTPESVRDSPQGQESGAAEGTAAPAGEAEGLGATEGRDDKGRFKSKESPEGGKPPVEGAPATDAQVADPSAQQAEQISAPLGWKAPAREHWSKIPRAAQEEIVRREKETSQTLRQSAQARQLANEFQQVVNPFMPLIQSQNSNPLAAVKNLMTTAAGLTVGTQQQKAQIVREIIQNYGIDIATLDQVLAGQPVQAQPAGAPSQNNMAPPPWAMPIFQFMNGVQTQQQQRQHQMLADAEAETTAFAEKNEFFEDLREDMADMMELAAKRGVILSIQEAYDRCAQLDPNIAPIIGQRKAAAKASNSNIQKNRNAASSVVGAPRNKAGSAPGVVGDDRRAALEEAWEQATGR